MSIRLHRARALVPFLAACLACVSAGCGSTVASSTAPSLAKCGVTLTAPAASVDSAGASATIAVSTQPECTWSATSEASWITGLTPASGQGTGEVKIDVSANPAISSRQGDVVVNGVRAQIRQEAAQCRFDLSSSSQTFDETGGTARISVTTLAGCAWTARADAPWVTVTSGSPGSGPGAITINVAANTGDARSASLAIADRTVRISQDAKPVLVPPPTTSCAFDVTPTSASVGAAGGGGPTMTVDTGAGCEWTAASNASWLTITSDMHSFGSGSVTFSAAANTGAARSGTLSIAGQSVTVNQAAASSSTCASTVTPMTLSLPSSGSTSSSFTVTSASGCAWTASENVSWMTITSGTSGSGNGTVKISVDANPTSSVRTGTLTIAGHLVTITEAGVSCNYTVSPTTVSIGATGGTGTPIGVTAAAGCAWTAASSVSWITLVTGQTGTGNGTVTYTVVGTTGPARSGTLTVAGQTVTVSQAACTYTINPTSQSFPTDGGTGGPVTVTTQSTCAWTATSNAGWITITSGASRTGTGTVTFTVAANTGGARTGTLTIAGSTFTVTQAKK